MRPTPNTMTITVRPFKWDNDFDLVRAFLIETSRLTDEWLNWLPSMFENIKFGPCGSGERADQEDELIRIWEECDDSKGLAHSKIVAVTHFSQSLFWIQIHPSYRLLEAEIIPYMESWRKETMTKSDAPEIHFVVPVTNRARIALLTKLGYEDTGLSEYNRRRPVNMPIPECALPEGFAIRHVDVERDFVNYKEVMTAVFPHCGCMTERMANIYASAQFYHPDLDIVVVAPTGRFAALMTVRIDPVSRLAELEPVGTHPDYRGRGLAKCMILEGLRRSRKYKPREICIMGAAPTEAANALYESVGFTDKTAVHDWCKEL